MEKETEKWRQQRKDPNLDGVDNMGTQGGASINSQEIARYVSVLVLLNQNFLIIFHLLPDALANWQTSSQVFALQLHVLIPIGNAIFHMLKFTHILQFKTWDQNILKR